MGKIADTLIDLSNMEKFVGNDTFIHNIDPRCKIVLTLIFTLTVISFNRYETVMLFPLFAFPLFILINSEIPILYLAKKILFVSLFALSIAIVNPFIDRHTIVHVGSMPVSGGWLSFISIMLRFLLTSGAALLLLLTTGMYDISKAMEKLGVPHIFTMQLFFLCRYIFSLTEDASRIERARAARSFGNRGKGIKVFNNILSSLFIRSLERAERVYAAMRCRGFDGSVKTMHKMRWKLSDTIFLLLWTLFFVICKARILNIYAIR